MNTVEVVAEVLRARMEKPGDALAYARTLNSEGLLLTDEVQAEVERLRRWQAEATICLDGWEEAWLAAGSPGVVGENKWIAMKRWVEDHRSPAQRWSYPPDTRL